MIQKQVIKVSQELINELPDEYKYYRVARGFRARLIDTKTGWDRDDFVKNCITIVYILQIIKLPTYVSRNSHGKRKDVRRISKARQKDSMAAGSSYIPDYEGKKDGTRKISRGNKRVQHQNVRNVSRRINKSFKATP